MKRKNAKILQSASDILICLEMPLIYYNSSEKKNIDNQNIFFFFC